MQLRQIAIKDIVPNTGQIEGLPANPRFIKDEKYLLLLESLRSLPSLTDPNLKITINGQPYAKDVPF